MYKKILLIVFSTLVKNPFTRCTCLMSFITYFIWITAKYRPFAINHMNYLEYYSGFCSLIIIVTSAFYIENENQTIQMTFLILIICVNTLFLAKWIKSVLKICLFKYKVFFMKYWPHFYLFCENLIETKGILSFTSINDQMHQVKNKFSGNFFIGNKKSLNFNMEKIQIDRDYY